MKEKRDKRGNLILFPITYITYNAKTREGGEVW